MKSNGSEIRGVQCLEVDLDQEEEVERVLDGVLADLDISIDPSVDDLTGVIEEKYVRKRKSKKKKADRPVLMWEVLEEENDKWVEENLKMDMDLINQN